MSTIEETVTERGKAYGDFSERSRVSRNIKRAMMDSQNWDVISPDKQEALEMIASKISRILNGNANHADSWHDIGGYAKLIEDALAIPDWV